MKNLSFTKMAFILLAFCAANALAASAQTVSTLLDFNGTNGGNPDSALVQGTDGNLYGTTANGGVSNQSICYSGCGTFFKVTAAGTSTTLYSFCSQSNCADGKSPGQILLAADGNFYGITSQGGVNCQDLVNPGCGTVFEITPAGALTTLYSFCGQTNCADGWGPNALAQGVDGNFYGTTDAGGTGAGLDGSGTIFKITAAGVLSTIYDFCTQLSNGNCADGALPSGMILATNGNFYGVASEGGGDDCGEVFEATPKGTLTVVHSYNPAQGCGGAFPQLFQASNGNFYGSTVEGGGAGRRGMVYEMTPGGRLSEVYGFCELPNCADGSKPNAVVQGTDGNFYGTTHGQLAENRTTDGTVFQLTPTGTLTTLQTFDDSNGAWPEAPLVQATNGNFYGTTNLGGTGKCGGTSCGIIFSVSMGLGPFVEASPNFGAAGRVVNILGNNLTGTTSVTLNGTPATFSVISSTLIKAQVPAGATSGTIEVTTPNATLSGNASFQIVP